MKRGGNAIDAAVAAALTLGVVDTHNSGVGGGCFMLIRLANGKFVAIDVGSGDYEIDEDDYAAVARLRSRKPAADVWLMRAGYPTTYRMGVVR